MEKPAIKVLYVDDDDALVRLIQRTLSRRGFEVSHAASSEQAFAAIAETTFDVIALDHYLGDATGLEFLKKLVGEREGAPPVVYVTGTAEMNVAVSALKNGASDFVLKSVSNDFLVLLASALEQSVEKSRLKVAKEAAEQQVRVARDRAEMLLAEVNHRVANSLALVASFVNLQAKSVKDQAAKDALAETQARIYAVSLVHRRLYGAQDVRLVELEEYLVSLLDHLQTSMRTEGHGASLSHSLAPLTLKTDLSINLGVIVTEWVTNAFKYAYPDRSGEIRVTLSRKSDNEAELVVEDDGVGRDTGGVVKGTGLGSRIVNAMAATMKATVVYQDRHPGLSASVAFPLQAQDSSDYLAR